MKRIYLAGPYTHPDLVVRTQRAHQLSYAAGWLIHHHNAVVYSPISMGHAIVRQYIMLPTDYAYWKKCCEHELTLSDELLVLALRGWSYSVGVREELAFARAHNIPISLLTLKPDNTFKQTPLTQEEQEKDNAPIL